MELGLGLPPTSVLCCCGGQHFPVLDSPSSSVFLQALDPRAGANLGTLPTVASPHPACASVHSFCAQQDLPPSRCQLNTSLLHRNKKTHTLFALCWTPLRRGRWWCFSAQARARLPPGSIVQFPGRQTLIRCRVLVDARCPSLAAPAHLCLSLSFLLFPSCSPFSSNSSCFL